MLGRVVATTLFVTGSIAVGCGGSGHAGFDGSNFDGARDGGGGTSDGSPGGGGAGQPGGGFGSPGGGGGPGGGGDGGEVFSDGSPDASGADACVTGDAGPPQYPQRCAPATTDECDGVTDTALASFGVAPALRNATGGNGFDDDCDGRVDEGCACPGNGRTKDCYVLPASQATAATGKPVGWCTENAKGSLDCAGTEFPRWSGTCRGGQAPFRHDVCAPGDFNCDGVPFNSDVQDCACKVEPVQCPTAPLVLAPYPDPAAIPRIDGASWITDPAQRASATNWQWTAVGGDCDNVLPNPTFALYGSASGAPGQLIGTRATVRFDANATPPRYVAQAGEPLAARQVGGRSDVFTAFGLSGDYLVQGEFDLGGKRYVCTQKVEVRAPGIRAELCWDTVGNNAGPGGNDIDLHVARLQGLTCPTPGWDDACQVGSTYADCWYSASSGCRDVSPRPPGWGYTDSPATACMGWSSKRSPNQQPCTNPRLDQDNIICDRSVGDPTSVTFCGPENINIDNPNDGDRFLVGVTHYANTQGNADARSHVNVYCNGRRVLSAGFNPVTGQNGAPTLRTAGRDTDGDYWTVARVRANVVAGQLASCEVEPIPSHVADPSRDGPAASGQSGNDVCVDTPARAAPAGKFGYRNQRFYENGAVQQATNGIPNTPADFCKH